MSLSEEIKINIDDTYMNVIRFGHGSKNLVIIAGVSLCGLEGQGEGVATAYGMFADDYTVYLFDRRKVLPDNHTVEDMGNDICEVLKGFGVEKADFFGCSQGGMIAQSIALKHPELVNKLVICSSYAKVSETIKESIGKWLKLCDENDVVSLNRSFFDKVYSEAFLKSVEALLPTLEKQGTLEDCKRFKVLLNACAGFDVLDKLDNISCPVLVIGDKNDRVTGFDATLQLIEKLNCESVIYDKYSHAVYDEAPDIKEKILAFLQK